jgi:hypothetical protein
MQYQLERTILNLTPAAAGVWAVYTTDQPRHGHPDELATVPVIAWALIEEHMNVQDRFVHPEDDRGSIRSVTGMVARQSGVHYAETDYDGGGIFVGYAYTATPDLAEWQDRIDAERTLRAQRLAEIREAEAAREAGLR